MPLRLATVAALLVVAAATPRAQDRYHTPSGPLARALATPPPDQIGLSPDRRWLLRFHHESGLSLSDLAAPKLGLAGINVDPRTNAVAAQAGLSRDGAIATYYRGFSLISLDGQTIRQFEFPRDARVGVGTLLFDDWIANLWSSDSAFLWFTLTTGSRVELWVADVATGRTHRATEKPLNSVYGPPCAWVPGRHELVCRMVPDGRGAPPPAPAVAPAPLIQIAAGSPAPSRTNLRLLKNPSDEAQFDYYFTNQIALISLDGRVRPIGNSGLHRLAQPSPDGRYLLVQTTHRPYSNTALVYSFPLRTEVWDFEGRVVRGVADVPLQDKVPIARDAVPSGERSIAWIADGGASLVWTEALDGGDPRTPAAKRDRVVMLPAPFTAQPRPLIDLEMRARPGAGGGPVLAYVRPDLALVTETSAALTMARLWAIDPSRPSAASRVLFEYNTEDAYADPGNLITHPDGTGALRTLVTEGRHAFLRGNGASPEGDQPFVDRLDLVTGTRERLWRSEAPHYERVVAVVDPQRVRLLTLRESLDDPPNVFVRDVPGGVVTQLTTNADPVPEFAGVSSRLIRYTRADGVDLSATLHLPPGYTPADGPIPFLLWAYPREFQSADAAAQVRGSPYRFFRPNRFPFHLFLLLHGYGVLDGPSLPIVAQAGGEPNDAYVEQLVAGAAAAVEAVVDMGVADRRRIAIGGHSYGAFMAANLLAHSNLFRAGIAENGAYNRSLTPFGFQNEWRTFWQAPDIYMRMSPFTYAHRIDEPLLIMHGAEDNNPGTWPMQAERLFAAVKGNGGRARLVMFPHEGHVATARETLGHRFLEMLEWLETHLKKGG